MNEGSLFATFVVVFREALEASLILGIILTVLVRLGARRYISHVLGSAVLAVILSGVAGAWLSGMANSAQEKAQEIIEGVISLAACGVLTYMFFWMERQARHIKSEIETKVEAVLSAKDDLAMISLSFFAVFREGAETVLFLKAIAIQSGGAVSWLGGISGLLAAIIVSAFVFAGGKKISLKVLFRVTGIFILLMAAGLLAYGIHELEEAGWVHPIIYPVWNINHILSDKEGVGSFLKALFGYNGNPSLTEVAAYWIYLGAILSWFLRQKRKKVIS